MKTNSNKPRPNFQVRNEQKKKFNKKQIKKEESKGLSVSVGDDFNKALRIFKKKVLNDGRLNDFHERQFHTKRSEKKIFSNGGRVINFVCLSSNFKESRDKIFNLINKLNWPNGFFRKDIGYKVIDE